MHGFVRIVMCAVCVVSAVALGLGWGTAPAASAVRIHAGESVPVGNGTARVIVAADAAGIPASVSVALTAAALQGLPRPDPAGRIREYVLPMPADAPYTGYRHVGLNWEPVGHPPAGVYSVPHFDVHFYLVDRAEQQAITFDGPSKARALEPPDGALVPEGYVVPPDTAVPRMGIHGVDTNGREFLGGPFDHTFLYGYHAGRLVFVEPMVAIAYLRTKPDVTVPVRTPRAYSFPGHYPTRYRIGYDPERDEYVFSLFGLKPFPPDARACCPADGPDGRTGTGSLTGERP